MPRIVRVIMKMPTMPSLDELVGVKEEGRVHKVGHWANDRRPHAGSSCQIEPHDTIRGASRHKHRTPKVSPGAATYGSCRAPRRQKAMSSKAHSQVGVMQPGSAWPLRGYNLASADAHRVTRAIFNVGHVSNDLSTWREWLQIGGRMGRMSDSALATFPRLASVVSPRLTPRRAPNVDTSSITSARQLRRCKKVFWILSSRHPLSRSP